MTNLTGIINESMNPFENYMEELGEKIASKVVSRIKAMEEEKPKYYTRKKLCEILHVSAPTIIEMGKRGEIVEKRIGGRVLYDAAEIDKAVKEKKIFRYKRRKTDSF